MDRISGYDFAKVEYPSFPGVPFPPSDMFMLWVDNESPFLAQLVFGFLYDTFQGVFDTTKNDIDLVTTHVVTTYGDLEADYDFMLHCEPIPSRGFRGYSHGSMFCEATATRVAGIDGAGPFSNSYTFFLVPGGTSEDVCPCAAEEVEVRSDVVAATAQ